MRPGLLWAVVLGSPLVWLGHLEVNYALVPWACGGGATHRAVLIVVALVALVMVLGAAVAVWSSWRTAGSILSTESAPPSGRNSFLALSGIGMSLFVALLIVATAIPIVVLNACK